jgi:hypothetical protein
MPRGEFLRLVQRRIANVAIAPSTLRNQGAPGVAEATRTFLADLDLRVLRGIDPAAYAGILEEWTARLMQQFPGGAQNWGTARKALNVFMVQAFLDRFLAEEYGLDRLGQCLRNAAR